MYVIQVGLYVMTVKLKILPEKMTPVRRAWLHSHLVVYDSNDFHYQPYLMKHGFDIAQ